MSIPDDFSPWFDPTHPMNQRTARRPTIDEIERLLVSEEDIAIEILPNGEVRTKGTGEKTGIPKVLTMRENLGGEYAANGVRSERDDGSTTPLLKSCPFCGGGETRTSESHLRPTMSGPGALISVEIRHFCEPLIGLSRTNVVFAGRDHAEAIAAWNRRPNPSPEDVERVARAICCPSGHCHIVQINERAETARHYPQPWPCCWQQHEERARAALSALGRGCK